MKSKISNSVEEAHLSLLKTCDFSPPPPLLALRQIRGFCLQNACLAQEISSFLASRTIVTVKSQNKPFRAVLRLRKERSYIPKKL